MKRHRRNGWTTDDKLLAAVAAVTAVGLFAIVKQKRAAASTATSGLGAYFVDPVNIPLSGLGLNGLGANYVSTR